MPDVHTTLYESALSALRAKDRAQAERYARAALELDPTHVKTLLLLARLSESPTEKTALYQRVIKIDPKQSIAHAYLDGMKGAKAAPPTIRRRNPRLWWLGGVLVACLGFGFVWINLPAGGSGAMPTLAVMKTLANTEQASSPTAMSTGEAAQAQSVREDAPLRAEQTRPSPAAGRQMPTLTPLPDETQVLFNVQGDNPPEFAPSTQTEAFNAPFSMPSATAVSFSLPQPDPATATRSSFNPVLPTSTRPPTTATQIPSTDSTGEDFVSEPTSTTLPRSITATPEPLPDMNTPLPPTDTNFPESPLSGGQMPTPVIGN